MVLCQGRNRCAFLLKMPDLGVNIDHVASVRQIRNGLEPEPAFAALICQAAGAESIVVHLREDRRHINEKDLRILKKIVKVKLNLEMSINPEIISIAEDVVPDQATLVPENRQEITTEGGLNVIKNYKMVKRAVERLSRKNIDVSLFIDPKKKQIDAAFRTGVKMIELHTGLYSEARVDKSRNARLKEIKEAADYASFRGLKVFAGHGLDYYNVEKISKIKKIEELNIGYSIICRAVITGLYQAVKEMKTLINKK